MSEIKPQGVWVDVFLYSNYFISVISVVFFCLCCFALIRAIQTPISLVNASPYSKSALRVSRGYKVISWGLLTVVFLISLVISFIEVFSQL